MMIISKSEVLMKVCEALPELMSAFRLILYQSAEDAVSKVLKE